MAQDTTEIAAKLKEQGTEAFQKKDYELAVKKYGEAIANSPCDHVLYSNRSAAYAGAKMYEEALYDGQKCVELKPDFVKGYGRIGVAQYHLNKFIDAKKSYQEGLKHDSQNQALKNGLKDVERNFKQWFVSVVGEATEAQLFTQQRLCEASHQLVTDGYTSLSFQEAHQKTLQLNLPENKLEKYGISEEDFHHTVQENQYDYQIMTAVQRMLGPTNKGDPERCGKIDMATTLEAHKFMATKMRTVVDEFNQLPDDSKHSIPKKVRENAAELQVSVLVEASFKIRSEDLELAVLMHEAQLQEDPAWQESQDSIGSLMKLLLDPAFIEKVRDQPSKSGDDMAKVSTPVNALESRRGTLAINIGIISAVGLVVLMGMIRWRAKNR